jgi:Ca-activated chloride channel family protein
MLATVVLGSALVSAPRAVQQDDLGVYKADNRTVAIYATVTGPDGRLVPDLPRDAFVVADNGRRQAITLFANTIQPITAVVLLDRSGSMRANFRLVERAAARFVEALLPGDRVRIGSFSNRIQLDPRDFTSDRGQLLGILRSELQPEGPTPLWNAVYVGITALLHQQGRRVILVFTDGVDSPERGLASNSLKDVMKRAEEEDVMVYAIGLAPAGLPRTGRRAAPGPGRQRGPGGRGLSGAPPFAEQPDEGLPRIAEATGGGYFELNSANDLAATFARVADELHHQYALGFTPETLDGKMHALEVQVQGAGMRARARRSYLARR